MVSIGCDLLNLSMGMDADLKQALKVLRYNVETPFGFYFDDDGKYHKTPPKEIYVPQAKISDEDWEKIKKSYRTKFVGLDIPIELIGRYLDNYWDNWNNGYYPNPDKFIDSMDKAFSDFADTIPKKGNQSFTSILWFDELFQKFQNKIEEITWDGSKDWERTWDGKIYNDILIEDAKGIEEEIKIFLKKRIKHGLDLTDEMKAFKGYEEIKKEHQPTPNLQVYDNHSLEQIKKAQSPENTDHEKRVMVKKIKEQSRQIKALKIHGKMPDKDTMKKLIDGCRFKTTEKCNDSALGRKLGKNSETAKAWVEKSGLSYYAYNPKHLK